MICPQSLFGTERARAVCARRPLRPPAHGSPCPSPARRCHLTPPARAPRRQRVTPSRSPAPRRERRSPRVRPPPPHSLLWRGQAVRRLAELLRLVLCHTTGARLLSERLLPSVSCRAGASLVGSGLLSLIGCRECGILRQLIASENNPSARACTVRQCSEGACGGMGGQAANRER